MKRALVVTAMIVLALALGVDSLHASVLQHTGGGGVGPRCTPSVTVTFPFCGKAQTGCLCVVTGGVILSGLEECGGCTLDASYSSSCSGPGSNEVLPGNASIACDSSKVVALGDCQCAAGQSLVLLAFGCGSCPE